MKKSLMILALGLAGITSVNAQSVEEVKAFKCEQFLNHFKNCTAKDLRCTKRNMSITEKLRVCNFSKFDLKALNNISNSKNNSYEEYINSSITTYVGLRKMINLTLMDFLKNSQNFNDLKEDDKKVLYKKLNKVYESIQSKLTYIEKTTDFIKLNENIPQLSDTDLFNNETFIEVQEDVNSMITFFDIVYINYSSFNTAHSLISELYPKGLEGTLEYRQNGFGSYTEYECMVIDRLLNFVDDSLLDVVFERACMVKGKVKIL
jgi:hypothetical protein